MAKRERKAGTRTRKKRAGAPKAAGVDAASRQLGQFAQLQLWTTENSTARIFTLRGRVKVNAIPIEGGGKFYTGFIRHMNLTLTLNGVEEWPTRPSFREVLSPEQARASLQMHAESKRESAYSAKVSAKFGGWLGSVDGSASLGGDRRRTETVEASAQMEIVRIEAYPNLQWGIGHRDYGDITKPNGMLDGPYLNGTDGTGAPLCDLRRRDNAQGSYVEGALSVSERDLHIVADGGYASDRPLSEGQHAEAISVLKDHLRSLRLMTEFDQGRRLVLGRGLMSVVADEDA